MKLGYLPTHPIPTMLASVSGRACCAPAARLHQEAMPSCMAAAPRLAQPQRRMAAAGPFQQRQLLDRTVRVQAATTGTPQATVRTCARGRTKQLDQQRIICGGAALLGQRGMICHMPRSIRARRARACARHPCTADTGVRP